MGTCKEGEEIHSNSPRGARPWILRFNKRCIHVSFYILQSEIRRLWSPLFSWENRFREWSDLFQVTQLIYDRDWIGIWFQLKASSFPFIMTYQLSLISGLLDKFRLLSPQHQSHPCPPPFLNTSLWSLPLSQPQGLCTLSVMSCSKPLSSQMPSSGHASCLLFQGLSQLFSLLSSRMAFSKQSYLQLPTFQRRIKNEKHILVSLLFHSFRAKIQRLSSGNSRLSLIWLLLCQSSLHPCVADTSIIALHSQPCNMVSKEHRTLNSFLRPTGYLPQGLDIVRAQWQCWMEQTHSCSLWHARMYGLSRPYRSIGGRSGTAIICSRH